MRAQHGPHAVPRRERGHGVEPETRGERLKLALRAPKRRRRVVGVPGDPVLPRRRKRVIVFVFVIVSRIAGRRIDRVLEDGAPGVRREPQRPRVRAVARGRVQAPHRARDGVARALERDQAPLEPTLVDTREVGVGDIHLAAHFKVPGNFRDRSSESRRSSRDDAASSGRRRTRELVGRPRPRARPRGTRTVS